MDFWKIQDFFINTFPKEKSWIFEKSKIFSLILFQRKNHGFFKIFSEKNLWVNFDYMPSPRVYQWIHTHTHTDRTYFIILNLGKSRNTGWISIDRQNEPSLQLTIPGSFKSSTKDLKKCNEWEEKRYTEKTVIYTQLRAKLYSIRISRVSSLEAFSCYPTHGSVAALSSRTTAFTGYAPQRFLSYWVAVLSECVRYSRIKLTCLATV